MAEELTVQHYFQQFFDEIDPSSSENINQSTNEVFSQFADTPTRRRNVILSKRKVAVKSLSSFMQGTSAIKHVVEGQHNPVLDAKFASFLVDVACESASRPHGSPSTPTRYSSDSSSEIDEPIDRLENIIESLNVLKTDPFQIDDDGQTWMKRLDIATLLPTQINKQTLPHLPSIILQKIIMQGQETMQRKKRARFHKSNSQSFEQKRVMIQKTNMILGYILTYYFLTEVPGEVHFPSFISYLSELVLNTGFVEKSMHSNDYSAFFAGFVTCLLDCMSLSIVAREQLADDASEGICLVMQGLSVAELNVTNFLDSFDINSVLTTILQITGVQIKRDLVTSIAKVMLDYTTSHHDDQEIVKSQITDLYNFIDCYSSPDKAQVYLQKFNSWSKAQSAGQTVGMKRMNYSHEMSFDSILIEIQALLSIPNERAAIRLVQYTDEQKFINFEHKQKTWYLLLDYLHQKDMLLNESRNSTFHMLTVGSSSGFESILSFFKQLVVLVLDEINDKIEERGGSPMTAEEEEWIRYHQHLVRRTVMKFCMRRAAYASNPLEIASNIAGMPLDENDYFSVYLTREQNIEYILNEVITTPERPLCLLGTSEDETRQQLHIEDSSDKVMHLDRNEVIPPSPANVPQNEEGEHQEEILEENSNYSADQVAFNENSYQRNDAEEIIAIDSDDDDDEQRYDEEAAEDSQNLYTDGDYGDSEDEQQYEKSDSAIDIGSSGDNNNNDEEESYEDEGAAFEENDDEDDARYISNQENVATQNNDVINIESDDEEQVEDRYDNQVAEVDESDRYAYERQHEASNSENDEADYGEEHYNSEDYGVEGEDDFHAESANESDTYSSGRYDSGDDDADEDGEGIIAEREVDNDINGSDHGVYKHQDGDEGQDSGIETADEDNFSGSDKYDSEIQDNVAANEGNISHNDPRNNAHQNNEVIAIDSDSEEDIYNGETAIGDEAEGDVHGIEDNIHDDEDRNDSVVKKSADDSDGCQVEKSETEGTTDHAHDKIEIGSFEPASDGNEGGFLGHDSQSFSDGSAGYHDEERSGNEDFTGDSDSCDQDLDIRQDDTMGGGEREVMQIDSSEEEDNSPQSSDTSDDMIDADDTMDDGNETAEQGISHANEDYEFDVPVAPPRHSSRSKVSSSPKGQRKHYESQTDDAAVESENYYAEASGADTETSIEKTDDQQSPSYKMTRTHLTQRKVVPSMSLPHANIEKDDGNDADIENTEDEGISKRSKKEAKWDDSAKPEASVEDREGVSRISRQEADEESDKEKNMIASEEEDKTVDEKAVQNDMDKEEASELHRESMEEAARLKAEEEEQERLRIEAEEKAARLKAEEEEQERLRIEAEKEEKAARLKVEEEEQERLRIEAEKEAEAARLKAEEEEQERLRIEAEEKAEAARVKAEEEEQERLRIEAEKEAEAARIKAEEEEQERLRIEAEKEEKAARLKAEEEEQERLRIEAEKVAEAARLKAEEEEQERLRIEAEEKAARLKAEEEEQERLRIEAEKEAEAARLKAEKEEQERLRIEAEEKAEAARVKAEEEEQAFVQAAAGLKDSNSEDFSTMSYRELQNECKKRNLSAKGSTNQLLDRLEQSHEEEAEIGGNQEEEEASHVDNNSAVSEDFSTMSYKDLRSYCVAHGISAKGKKADILERLRTKSANSEEDTESENDNDSDDDNDEGNDDLSTISYRELQDMCKSNNLKASGKRDVLIERLRNKNSTNVGDVSQPIKEEDDQSEDSDRKPSAYEQNKPKKLKTRTTFIENPDNDAEDKQTSTSLISKVFGFFSPKSKKPAKAMVEVTEILSSDDEEEGIEKMSTPTIPEHIKLEAPDSTVSAMNSPSAQSTVSALTVPGVGGSVANERKRRAGRPPKPPSSNLKKTQDDNEKPKRRKRSNSAASESSVRSTRSTRSQSRKK